MSALTPFIVDPEALRRIRPMRAGDAESVARLHAAAMGESLWAQLGEGFLRAIYRALVNQPDFLGYVYEEDDRVAGFIAGTVDGSRMMRRTLRRHWASLATATLRGLLSRPLAAVPLAQTMTYFRRSDLPAFRGVAAESMFCSFEPHLRGRRISGLINKVLFDELARRGHDRVRITTDADNREAARQLTSWGFTRAGSFRFYGKEMAGWLLDLANCERVEPVRREQPSDGLRTGADGATT